MQRNYTNEDVRRYMDEHECGAIEATKIFERDHLLKAISDAELLQDFNLLCDVVRELVIKVSRFA